MPRRLSTPLRSSSTPEPQQGQGVIEYTLVICLCAVTVVVLLLVLGEQVATLFTGMYERLASILASG